MVALLLSACSDGGKTLQESTLNSADRQSLLTQFTRLVDRQIVFAHQSVGSDILAGVELLAQRAQVQMPMRETRSARPEDKGIVHFKVGRNEAPEEKLADFRGRFSSDGFPYADLAILKLCYIDFIATTDGVALGQKYVDLLDTLQQQHQSTRFIAVTAPLTVEQTGIKAWIKRALGREPAGIAENRQRSAFNTIVRSRYAAGNQLFDLAAAESGSSEAGQSLRPELASDGRHLNEKGQIFVARELLRVLASQP